MRNRLLTFYKMHFLELIPRTLLSNMTFFTVCWRERLLILWYSYAKGKQPLRSNFFLLQSPFLGLFYTKIIFNFQFFVCVLTPNRVMTWNSCITICLKCKRIPTYFRFNVRIFELNSCITPCTEPFYNKNIIKPFLDETQWTKHIYNCWRNVLQSRVILRSSFYKQLQIHFLFQRHRRYELD